MHNQLQQKESTLKIIFSSVIALFLVVAGTEFSQNMVFAAVKTNSTNMMITDTDTKMMMNGFSGMSWWNEMLGVLRLAVLVLSF